LNDRNEEVKHFVYALLRLFYFGCSHLPLDLRWGCNLADLPA